MGSEKGVINLIAELQRDRYHAITVVAACLAQPSECL